MWSREELIFNLKHQLKALAISCFEYDKGDALFALDIAHKLRLLAHQTSNSHALIHQLSLDKKMFFCTLPRSNKFQPRVEYTDGTSVSFLPVFKIIDSPMLKDGCFQSFYPYLNTSNFEKRTFDEWFNKEVVCSFSNIYSFSFTRSAIVGKLTNQAGGSHVDPSIKKTIFDIYKFEAHMLGWDIFDIDLDNNRPVRSPFFATLRQIAHELILSLSLEELQEHLQHVYFSKVE